MNHLYVLNRDGDPQPCPDVIMWATWMEADPENRIVKKDNVDGVEVSTVFLGINHDWTFEGPPVLWETMIFGGEYDSYQRRYSSKSDALAGHEEALALVKPVRMFKLNLSSE